MTTSACFVPLSSSEERFYHQSRIYPESGAFNERKAIAIRGHLKIDALQSSLNAIIARHQALRAHVSVARDGAACRDSLCIQPTLEYSLPVVDVDPGVDVWQLCTDEVSLAFDCSSPPLFRMKLFRVSENEHVLAMSMHHMISDGDPNFRIILRELSVFYEYFSGSTDQIPKPAAPVPRSEIQVSANTSIDFWRECLETSEGHVGVSWKSSRQASQDFSAATIRANLPQLEEAVASIKQEVGAADVTPVLLALFQSLLARLTHQHDVSIGMPVFCRDVTDNVRETLGYYGNVIVVRTHIEPTKTLEEIIFDVHDFLGKAKPQERVPFQEIVKVVCPDWRNRWNTPLFNILFVVDQEDNRPMVSGGASFQLTDLDLGQVPYDVIFTVRAPQTGPLRVVLEYRRDRVTKTFATTILECFRHFTLEAAKQVKQAVGTVGLMPVEKARACLRSLNQGTDVPYPSDKTVHQVFMEQVSRTPDAPAVTDSHAVTLTYEELDKKSSQLCSHLVSINTRKQVSVGILMERSLDFVVAALAVLKSGGVYVPLDPAVPLARLSLFVKKSGMSILISQKSLEPCAESLREAVPGLLSIVPAELGPSLPEGGGPLGPGDVGPLDLAYIMFTSGSTGEPKAVEVPHRAIIRLVKNTKYVQLDADTTSLLHSPLTFDASTLELWGPLCNGGRVVVAPPGKLSAGELSGFSSGQGVNLLWLTSGTFNIMTEFHAHNLRSVRQLLTGGDVVSPQRAATAAKNLPPHCTLTNGYGPTECTTFSSFYNIPASVSTDSSVPIGRPLANTRLYVLGEDLSPVPLGATGILFIGGHGLARGYRPHEDVNNERFVPAPELVRSLFPGETRLFRSDDLVRVSEDPSDAAEVVVYFLGRRDTQVKVSGIRVEPGEVEGHIRSHSAVRDAVAMQEGEKAGQKILACYAVLLRHVQTTEIRDFLKKNLPDYMIPSKFVSVDEIPLTENGKVARRDLPRLASTAEPRFRFLSPGSASPQSALEQGVASVWGDVLGMEGATPKLEDNFFSIGGHSLLAQLVVARVSSQLGVEIPLLAIFTHPNLSAFVRYIEKAKSTLPRLQRQPSLPSPSPTRDETSNCHTISQQQEEYIEVFRSGKHTAEYHISAVFSTPGRVRAQSLQRSIDLLVGDYEILRAVYRTGESGETLQIIKPPKDVASPVKEDTIRAGQSGADSLTEVYKRAAQDINVPFDFENGPLLRCSVYYGEDDDQTTVVLSCNHMVMDDIALWIFAREMMVYYKKLAAGRPPPAAVERRQYTDFIRAQQTLTASRKFLESKEFWEHELTSLPKPPLFPLSVPVSRNKGEKLLRVVSFPVENLKRASTILQASPFAILLAANYIAVYHVTGCSDFSISFPVASRDVWNQRTVGTFARRIAVRLSSAGRDANIRDVVRDVAENLVRVLEHQDYPMPRGSLGQLVSMFKLSYVDLSAQYLPDGATFHCLPLNSLTENLVLFLDAFADEKDVHMKVCYLEGVFDDVTVDTLLAVMETLLGNLAPEPNRSLGKLFSDERRDEDGEKLAVFLARDEDAVCSPGCVAEAFVRLNGSSARTWLLGRYDIQNDGTIGLMRHTSRQVELDRHIVDLGFIESLAVSLDQVHDCAALVTGDARLVIFFVATSGSVLADMRTGALQSVFDELPDSQLVQLPCVPLTTDGAVDTEALCSLHEQRGSNGISGPRYVNYTSTPRKHAFLQCGHLNFDSAVTAQNDEFKPVFIARIHAH